MGETSSKNIKILRNGSVHNVQNTADKPNHGNRYLYVLNHPFVEERK